ncbi:PEPxxWA-CTERM sorting domain-containing protein [Phenylobacterium sp.]|uniref:PEPxxWA-CTERM sorting domain-containing protein n=1 Tax=Phenylobacterium sp. TaxID=1871053 RepID=UPI00286A9AD1|nr:PEPxxWA-CTERM sorting domain-containing protein [Phenylobacterium sp.]
MNKIALALLATTLLAAAPAQAGNLLTNGSFESGLSGWTLGGSSGDGYPPVVITNLSGGGYPTGAFGEVVPNDNAVGNPGFDAAGTHGLYFVADLAHPQTLSQVVSFVAGTSYTFGFDVYLPANGAHNVNDATLSATVAGLTFASFSASASPVTSWNHFSGAGTALVSGAGAFTFSFNSFGYPAKDFVIDRAYFASTKDATHGVPERATWAMMVSGFGLMGASLRRRRALLA